MDGGIHLTTLVAIGCSHANGCMIDGEAGSSRYNQECSYAGVFSHIKKFNYINMSTNGASNQYIYRNAIKFVTNHMIPKEDYFFMISWTGWPRLELRYNDDGVNFHDTIAEFSDHRYIPFTSQTHPDIFKETSFKKLLKFSPDIFDKTMMMDHWASYIYGLQCVFKNNKIPYVMFNTCDELEETANNKGTLEHIDTKKYYKPFTRSDSFLTWSLNEGYKKTPCWHLGADAHFAWAELIIDFIDENNK